MADNRLTILSTSLGFGLVKTGALPPSALEVPLPVGRRLIGPLEAIECCLVGLGRSDFPLEGLGLPIVGMRANLGGEGINKSAKSSMNCFKSSEMVLLLMKSRIASPLASKPTTINEFKCKLTLKR